MGNCVLRDCGFDVERRNDNKLLEELQDKRKTKKEKPLPRVSADGNTDEEDGDSEMSDEYEEEESPKKKPKNRTKKNPVTVQIRSSEENSENEDSVDRENGENEGNRVNGYQANYNEEEFQHEDFMEIEKELYEFMVASSPDLLVPKGQAAIPKKSAFAKSTYATEISDSRTPNGKSTQDKFSALRSTHDGTASAEDEGVVYEKQHTAKFQELDFPSNKSGGSLNQTKVRSHKNSPKENTKHHSSNSFTLNRSKHLQRHEEYVEDKHTPQKSPKITVSKELVIEPKINRGRGFPNVYFKDLVQQNANMKSQVTSPVLGRVLTSEISDNDRD